MVGCMLGGVWKMGGLFLRGGSNISIRGVGGGRLDKKGCWLEGKGGTLSWLWELSLFLYWGPLCGLRGGCRLINHGRSGLDFSSQSSRLHLSRLSQVTFIDFLEPTPRVESPRVQPSKSIPLSAIFFFTACMLI